MIQHASNSGYLAYCAALAPLTNVSKHNKLGSNGRVLLPIHALCIRYGSERTAESTHSSTDLHGYGQTCAKELQQSWTKLKILTFSPVLFVFLQFIPDFMRHAKIRIKELGADLRVMPRSFADENQRWDAFRQVISNVRDELKDILSVGNDGHGRSGTTGQYLAKTCTSCLVSPRSTGNTRTAY